MTGLSIIIIIIIIFSAIDLSFFYYELGTKGTSYLPAVVCLINIINIGVQLVPWNGSSEHN